MKNFPENNTGRTLLYLSIFLFALTFKTPAYERKNKPPWPCYLQNRRHTGKSHYKGPTNPTYDWIKALPDGRIINFMSSVGEDGTIYVGTWGNSIYEDNSRGKLYALNDKGGIDWVYDPGPPNQPLKHKYKIWGTIEGSVCIDSADGTLFFGRGDNKLYALNNDGSLKWVFPTFPLKPKPEPELGGQIIGSPMQDKKGTVYFGTIPYSKKVRAAFYAVNRDGSLRWRIETTGPIWSSPAIADDGTVYFGTWKGTFYAVKDKGQGVYELRKIQRKKTVKFDHPAISSDGTVYVTASEIEGFGKQRAQLYAIKDDGKKLKVKWIHSAAEDWEWLFRMVIDDDGTIFLGSGALIDVNQPLMGKKLREQQKYGAIYRVKDKGAKAEVRKIRSEKGAIELSAIDSRGILYYGIRGGPGKNDHGRVMAIKRDGTPFWKKPVFVKGEIWWGSPIVADDGKLIVSASECAHLNNLLKCNKKPKVYMIKDR